MPTANKYQSDLSSDPDTGIESVDVECSSSIRTDNDEVDRRDASPKIRMDSESRPLEINVDQLVDRIDSMTQEQRKEVHQHVTEASQVIEAWAAKFLMNMHLRIVSTHDVNIHLDTLRVKNKNLRSLLNSAYSDILELKSMGLTDNSENFNEDVAKSDGKMNNDENEMEEFENCENGIGEKLNKESDSKSV